MPSPETIQAVLTEIVKSAANYRYFFDTLHKPSWLTPLAAQELFKVPPGKEAVDDGFMFPLWPASQYLARMAKLPEAQDQVLQIVQTMQVTDNVFVHADLCEIVLALPPKKSAKLGGRVKFWVQTPFQSPAKDRVGDIISHLANGGQSAAALQIARDTLALQPKSAEEAAKVLSPEPHAWLDDWHYNEALKKAIPSLAIYDGQRTLGLLCDLLVRALEASRNPRENRHIDYSYIWHEAIENDEYPPRVRNSLISATRDAAAAFVDHDVATNLPRALGELRRYDWPLFKRLELDLLRRFPDLGREEIILVLPGVIDVEPPTHHEAALLLKVVFGRLPEAVKEDLLNRINVGPPEDDVQEWLGTEATPENIEAFMTHWRARRYQLIANQLPPTWQERAREVMAQAGTVPPLDQVNEGATWLGPSSPKTAADLAYLGPEAVLSFLRDWQPNPKQSTPEGLGRVLQDVIAKDPIPYVNRAADFRTVDPTFARFFFSGLESALKEDLRFDWQPVLDFALWVVTQPQTITGRHKALMEADPDWGWTRGTIANLLETGMGSKTAIKIAHRTQVWDILAPLTGEHRANTRL